MPSPKDPEISHFLGVDYGKAKIGLAIGNSETGMAFGYGTLENNKQILSKLAEIIQKESVEKVIIGVPAFLKQENQGSEEVYKEFGKTLQNFLPEIKIVYADEMFTTKMAQANLIEKGVKRIGKHDDEEAARIILQSWLDQKGNL